MTSFASARSSMLGQHGRIQMTLLLFLAVFLGPMIAAYLYYETIEDTGPERTVNRGELVAPAQSLTALPVARLDGTPLEDGFLQEHWTLLQVAPGPCDTACKQAVYDMRQVHIALGKEQHRVQRLLVLPSEPEDLEEWRRIHPELTITTPQEGGMAAVMDALGQAMPQATQLYVVDPLGNLMMRYDPAVNAKDVLKDMERLLKVSQIG